MVEESFPPVHHHLEPCAVFYYQQQPSSPCYLYPYVVAATTNPPLTLPAAGIVANQSAVAPVHLEKNISHQDAPPTSDFDRASHATGTDRRPDTTADRRRPDTTGEQTPDTAVSEDRCYATVRFKKGSVTYLSDFAVGEGEYVIVEADRGEHIGVVSSVSRQAPKYKVLSRVIRCADAQDIVRLNKLRLKEETTLVTVRTHVHKLSVNLRVTDTEYQVDGKKLTIYYRSDAPADFRKLQRRLHSKFKCRIWLMLEDEATEKMV